MEFFKQNTKIKFMAIRKWTYAFSACIVIGSAISLFMNPLNLSLEFTGGTELILKYSAQANLSKTEAVGRQLTAPFAKQKERSLTDEVRDQLRAYKVQKKDDTLFPSLEVANYGASSIVMVKVGKNQVKTAPITSIELNACVASLPQTTLVKNTSLESIASSDVGMNQDELASNLLQCNVLSALSTHNEASPAIVSVTDVGSQVGKEMLSRGVLAVIVALLLTMCYIAFRFEYRFAVSSTLALIHDPLLIMGVFAYLHTEFDLTALAAVLTVIGYSLNDTIVVFDRVRENFRKVKKELSPFEVVDLSINQTLSRTIMTSGLTLIAVVVLFFFGGPVVHGFALAMIIGIVIGTYSSIYVAGALALSMGLTRKDLIPAPKKELDDRP